MTFLHGLIQFGFVVFSLAVMFFAAMLTIGQRARRYAPWAPPAVALIVLAVSGLVTACTFSKTDNTNINSPSQVQAPPATPAPSPNASPSSSSPRAAVAVVEVHYFGKSLGTAGKDIRVGEVGDVTASPYDAQGTDVGQPLDPVSWSCTSGVTFVQSTSNHYNGSLTGKTAGAYTCTATAGGVTGSLAGSVLP